MFSKLWKIDDSHEFKPIIAEIESEPVNPLGRFIFWFLVVMIMFFGVWMYFGKIDIVVSSRGMIIPKGNVKIVQALETGIIKEILCNEGELVEKDQVLMIIDPATTNPQMNSLSKEIGILSIELDRLAALKNGHENFRIEKVNNLDANVHIEMFDSTLKAQMDKISSLNKELERIRTEIKRSEQDLEFSRQILEVNVNKEKRLKKVLDIIARNEYDTVTENILVYKNKVSSLESGIKELSYLSDKTRKSIDFEKNSFKSSILSEYIEKQKKLISLKSQFDNIRFRNEKQILKSPVKGYVKTVFVSTIGGVVTSAQELISVVPFDSKLEIEALIQNRDIGFVEDGMPVSIKIDTYSFQKYGKIDGVVTRISKDSINDEKLGKVYKVIVKPLNTSLIVEGRQVEIGTGMTLTAEIKVGKRRIIEFFIYPLIKYWDEGMSVR